MKPAERIAEIIAEVLKSARRGIFLKLEPDGSLLVRDVPHGQRHAGPLRWRQPETADLDAAATACSPESVSACASSSSDPLPDICAPSSTSCAAACSDRLPATCSTSAPICPPPSANRLPDAGTAAPPAPRHLWRGIEWRDCPGRDEAAKKMRLALFKRGDWSGYKCCQFLEGAELKAAFAKINETQKAKSKLAAHQRTAEAQKRRAASVSQPTL